MPKQNKSLAACRSRAQIVLRINLFEHMKTCSLASFIFNGIKSNFQLNFYTFKSFFCNIIDNFLMFLP